MYLKCIVIIGLSYAALCSGFDMHIEHLKPCDNESLYILNVQFDEPHVYLRIFSVDKEHPGLAITAREDISHITNFADFMQEFLVHIHSAYAISIEAACFSVGELSGQAYDAMHLQQIFYIAGSELEANGLFKKCVAFDDHNLLALHGIFSKDRALLLQGYRETMIVNGDEHDAHLVAEVGSCLIYYVENTPISWCALLKSKN